ncbi:MAG: hypothetical protein AAB459_00875 [Patescibacteria group bacterium]
MSTQEQDPAIGHLFDLYEDGESFPMIVGGVVDSAELRRAAEREGHDVVLHDLSEFAVTHANVA